jgi:hypothetical protein
MLEAPNESLRICFPSFVEKLEIRSSVCTTWQRDEYLYFKAPRIFISFRKRFDLQFEPFESNNLLVESDRVSVPWIPLTPTLLLPYHIDFERIPLTFCPRNKRRQHSFLNR